MMRALLFIAVTAAVIALRAPHPTWYGMTMYALLFACICLYAAWDPDPPTQEEIDEYLGPIA